MPFFNDGSDHPMWNNTQSISSVARYAWMGGTNVVNDLVTLLTHEESLIYYCWIFLPLLLLSFAGFMFMLPASTDFLANILSEASLTKRLYFHYQSIILPVLIIAACYGVLRLRKKNWNNIRWIKNTKLIAAIFIINLVISAIHMKAPITSMLLINNDDMAWVFESKFKKLKSFIPKDAAIFTDSFTASTLSDRKVFFSHTSLTDYHQMIGDDTGKISKNILLDKWNTNTVIFRLTLPVFTTLIGSFPYIRTFAKADYFIESPEWGITYWDDPWLVLERNKESIGVEEELHEKFIEIAYKASIIDKQFSTKNLKQKGLRKNFKMLK